MKLTALPVRFVQANFMIEPVNLMIVRGGVRRGGPSRLPRPACWRWPGWLGAVIKEFVYTGGAVGRRQLLDRVGRWRAASMREGA
ncbi:hypothetical protein CSH63_16565 [Micromonospora tulbaghiae]|uniref:Uncharacterized protein n=1 Tax=Micromonospora tulbaghiae TaxID=479978 RepID=A0A386WLZ3_9ACTN|nr:hypothetical protein CSH63_16565 [Micromonospora tulbaghiae]